MHDHSSVISLFSLDPNTHPGLVTTSCLLELKTEPCSIYFRGKKSI